MPATQRAQATMLASPDTFATVLITICGDRFGLQDDEGTSFLEWDPETLRMEIDEEFSTKITDANFNKLMAAIRLITEDVFYQSLPDFIMLCNALFNGTVTPGIWDPADTVEVAWGITEAMLLWPPDARDEEPFAEEIVAYIAEVVRAEGIMDPPDVLRLGGIDDDLRLQVQGAFTDDPKMFQMIYEVEQGKTDEINALVKGRLHLMLEQLDSLPLRNGQAENMVQQLLKGLQDAKTEGDKLRPISF